MTTITTDSIPTTDRNVGLTSRTWRYVATFAAGAFLSVAVAAGIGAATDDSPSTPAPAGSVSTHISSDECPGFAGKPC